MCVLSSHLFWTSDLWTHQPGSHRRKVTQDFSSTFLPACLKREGFSRPFPSSTVKSNFGILCTHELIALHHLLGKINYHYYYYIFIFVRKNPSSCDCHEISRPNVMGFRSYQLNHRGDRLTWMHLMLFDFPFFTCVFMPSFLCCRFIS